MLEGDLDERPASEEDVLGRCQRLETLGTLTGAVAHDFGNLLLVIFGATEIARGATRDPRVEVELGRIEEASLRAAGLVRQLLEFARGRPGELKPVRLGETVLHLMRLLEVSLGDDIKFEVQADRGLWPVLADPTEMDQLLLNLALNARDAMPRGGNLDIRLSNVEGPSDRYPSGDHVRLVVSDTGHGMTPETVAKIFDPFFSTKASGTGLGLSTCKRIVERVSGSIEVVSALDRGAVFTVRLPRAPGR